MAAVFVQVEAADDRDFVWLRASASPNPERKPAMLVARDELRDVVLMLLDTANSAAASEVAAW
jgi:hypothetical protein